MYSVSLPSSYTKPNNQKKGSAQNLCICLDLPNEIPLFFSAKRASRVPVQASDGTRPRHSASSQRVSTGFAGVLERERSPRFFAGRAAGF